MKKTRFTEIQIVAILNKAGAGLKVKEICRKHGISEAIYYNWKSKYGGHRGVGFEADKGAGGRERQAQERSKRDATLF